MVTCPHCERPIHEDQIGPLYLPDGRPVDRFWRYVDQSAGPEECWPFTGSLSIRGGYGQFRMLGRTWKAHRLAYGLTFGWMADGDNGLHRCVGHPECCNPRHIYPGTQQNNVDDMIAAGRHRPGETKGYVLVPHLTEDDLGAMRDRRADGESLDKLARAFGTSRSVVTRIVAGPVILSSSHRPQPSQLP